MAPLLPSVFGNSGAGQDGCKLNLEAYATCRVGEDLRINPPLTIDFTKRFVTVMPIPPMRCSVSAPHSELANGKSLRIYLWHQQTAGSHKN